MQKMMKPNDAIDNMLDMMHQMKDVTTGFMIFLEMEGSKEGEVDYGTYFYGLAPPDAVFLLEKMKQGILLGTAGETLQ
jgi:hypothetical protein